MEMTEQKNEQILDIPRNGENKNESNWKGYLLVSIGVVMWSFSEILQKLLQDTVPPMSKSFFRFFIGIMPLLIILLFQKDLDFKNLLKNNKWEFFIGGFFAFGIGNYIYFLGIERTQANIGSAIYGSYPIFISIYSIFILKENQNIRRRMVGYLIGLTGIFILVTNLEFQKIFISENIIGNALVLIGSLIWSFFSVLGKKVKVKEAANLIPGQKPVKNIDLKWNIGTMGYAMLVNLFLVLMMPQELETFFIYPAETWLYLILLGVFCTGIGTWLFFVGISKIALSKGISIAMLKPIWVMFFAFIILGELPSPLLVFCLPMILFAVYLVTKK